MCSKLFTNINNSTHKLYNLLPPKYEPVYQLRNTRIFERFETNTDRFMNTFIPRTTDLSQRNFSVKLVTYICKYILLHSN